MATRGESTGSNEAGTAKDPEGNETDAAAPGFEADTTSAEAPAPDLPAELVAALSDASARPADVATWEHLDALADTHNAPDEVLEAYRAALAHGLARGDASPIAERAVAFCQAWFIDTPEAMPALLTLIVDKYPELDWAFDRLVVALTSSAQWNDLLARYDRSLAATRDEARRKQLLEDAARLAKDFADAPDRAADYLQQLLTLDPDNAKLIAQLERMLERRGRTEDLLVLWRRRLQHQSPDEARTTRIRIAALSLDQVGSAEQALAELQPVVDENPGHAEASALLERILASDADTVARQRALGLLRTAYEVTGRPEEVVRVLTTALDFVTGEDGRSLRREVANRLAILGRDEASIAQYRALLEQDPTDVDARRQLRHLARKADRRDLFVEALLGAAEAAADDAQRVALWLTAADVRHRELDDDPGAIALYQRALDAAEDEGDARRAAHQLNELLARAELGEPRLAVLERLSRLERAPSLRRQLLAEAARLAESLGDRARSIASWRRRLELETHDLEALAALVRLYEAEEDWDEVVTALQTRAGGPVSGEQRRADLARVASLQAGELARPEDAIATWTGIREEFGDAPDILSALDPLLAAADRHEELATLLDAAVHRERDGASLRLVRLGDVLRGSLDRAPDAITLYRQALELDPADEKARAGARALLDDPLCTRDAAEALWRAHGRQNETEEQLTLVETRLGTLARPGERAALLAEAASMYEQVGDPAGALEALARAVTADPTHRAWHDPLERLAGEADDWARAAAAYREAAEAAETPAFAADLRHREARIHQTRAPDPNAAYEALAAAATLSGTAQDASAAARAAADAGRWAAAAGAVAHTAARRGGRPDAALLDDLHEAIVDDPAARRTYAAALARAAGEAASPSARAELLRRAAGAFPEAEDDDVRDAIAAAEKALALEPHAIDTRRMVVTLLRRAPQPSLVDHLFVLADATPDSLDALREAADTALGLEDDALARRALEALFERATTRWHQGQTLTGKHDAPSSARWALEKLTGLIDDRRVVAERLLRGGELPFSPEERSALNRRAADMFQQLDAPLRAIDAYRRALADAPEDVTLIRSLAFLCENEEARSGASALRERELALTEELTPRLSLRLKELERTGALGAGTRQLDLLRANLADAPGHPASVDAVVALLRERGAPRQLVEILEGQATQLEEKEETRRAAELWLRAAEVAEREVGDPGQAIRAYERAIAIDPTPRSYDALARLHMDRGQPVEAARWLSERLAIATDKEAVAVRLKLARARLAAGQETDAVTTLTEAFADAPQSAEVRKQLIPLLRQREDWRTLAATLVRSVEHTTDDAAVLAYAREAAEVLHLRLDAPAEAVEALRRAVTLAPDDRKLRSMLAEGLRARGDLDEAQDMLETTIKAFGRRGSRERAEAHIQLARVLHARGDAEAALAQLDVATKMDADNVASLQTLAEFAREAGELQRAEAALRMLLLTTRRLTADEARDTPIGTSEVLFELASLAQARGQDDQAEELAESAIEALAEGDVHAPRLQQRLRDKGEFALLARLLDARLRYVRSPYRRGQILHEKAEAWSLMGDASRALTARLEAVEADPGSPVLHEGLRELAEGQDALATYEEKLRALLEVTRRDTDAMVRCELLLRQAEIALVRGDHAETQARLDDAVQTGVREVDVLRAMARLAGERGDETEQLRILEQLASLGEDQVASRADALYRMAEVQLAAEDSLEVGLASLRRAIGDNPSPKRAATILRRATERHPEHTELLDLYEQVVRDSGDDATILHYLERRADHGSASAEQIREATQRAESLGDEDRVGKLMRRAVELARERDDLSGFDWALLGLAERALSAGDVEEAVRWLQDAGEVAEAEALFALSRRVAEAAAGDGGKPELAAGLYEKLRERDAMARDAWEPLVRIYTQLDDLERLERVVRETLDGLQEVGDRNALRIGLAGALLRHDDRVDDAIVVTREALFDAPGDPEALSLLTQSLERAGRTEELSDLLRDQLAGAKERGDAETVKATATRLVGMLEAEPAAEVLRDALELGDDVDLIEALLERLGEDDARERAELVERQLELARDDAAAAASLAKRAAELFERAEEPDGVLRVLERGLEYAPSDVAIRDRLEAHYRSQNDHLGLTRILESTAASTDDPDRKVELMAEAARVHLDELNDAATAAQLLAQARVLHPTDAELTSAHARAVAAQGDRGDAIQILGEGLERCDEVHHLTLLTARADLRREEGDDDGVLADLETAFSLDADAVRESLSDALESRRMRAAGEDDQATERRVTLRIADLLQEAGRRDDARMMLTDFSDRHEDELEITQRLLSLARDEDQWEEVERLSLRLVDALEGDGQVEAAAHFFEACERQGQPENAREVLERVWAARPGDAKIRGEVRRLYELIGAHGELARLLIEEAQDIDDQDEKVAHLRWAGEALLSTGDLEPAVGALQQVLELVEDDAEALCLLADVRIMEADYTGAHQLLDDAIGRARRTSPTLFMLYQRKSYVHQAEGDPYAQLDALKRAYQAARKNPHVAAELADLAESLEDWDLAVTTLRAITAMEDQGPISAAHALVRQGRIALRLGDEKRAKLCARRAAMTQADDETVQAFLAEIGEG